MYIKKVLPVTLSNSFSYCFLEIPFSDEEKFDCIVVSYAPTKAYVDYLMSELENTMVRCLQKSVTTSMSSVKNFLNDATDTLTRHPESIEDIAVAKRKHDEFIQKRGEVSVFVIKSSLFITTFHEGVHPGFLPVLGFL